MSKYHLSDIDTNGIKTFDLSRCTKTRELFDLIGQRLFEYENFVDKYGNAEIVDFIRLLAPDDIIDQHENYRCEWNSSFRWTDDDTMLDCDDLEECFPLANTIQGDEFIFKAGSKAGIYCLPRDNDIIYFVGHDLSDIVNFALCSGKLIDLNDYYQDNPPERLFLSK